MLIKCEKSNWGLDTQTLWVDPTKITHALEKGGEIMIWLGGVCQYITRNSFDNILSIIDNTSDKG